MNLKELANPQEFDTLIESMEKPFYLFKHSTICPVSSRAMGNVERFMQANPTFPVYRVLVLENRPLSSYVSEVFQVAHQSPQIYLISDKKCIWNASHMAINEQVMREKLENLTTK